MKRWIQISIWTILVLLASWMIFTAKGWAQEKQAYMVPDFNGGINVATDGTNLRPNEALEIVNMTLDTIGVLSVRQGFSYLDSVVIDINEEIEAIYVYEPYEGTERMLIATNTFLYVLPSLSDPGDVDWDTLRLGFSDDSLIVREDSVYVRSIKANRYFYPNTEYPDILIVDGDTSGTVYLATPDSVSGRKINLAQLYHGADDTATYKIYAKIPSNPTMNQIGNKLYIFDDNRHTLVYNDTTYQFLALIDSGTVADTLTATTDSLNYRTGRVHFEANIAIGDTNNGWSAAFVGGVLNFYGNVLEPTGNPIEIGPGGVGGEINLPDDFDIPGYPETISEIVTRSWSSEITDYDSERNAMILKEPFSYMAAQYWYVYSITYLNTQCNFDADLIIEDTTKNWDDTKYGDEYLRHFYAAFQGVGILTASRIYCNDATRFQIKAASGRPSPDSQYFIFSALATRGALLDSMYKLSPSFEQGIEHFGEFYAIGKRLNENLSSVNRNRLWYSGEAMPFYMKYFKMSTDVDANENISVLFQLRSDAYIGSSLNIWRLSGTFASGNNIIRKVVSNNGIPDYDNWAKATEEYGYFTNRTGVYWFDGVRPQKISWRVDPIIQANYASRIVMVYQNYRLYVSFPDSNFTLLYNEPLEAWTKLDFGMTCAYAPPDTNIIYFGHSEFKGRVYYYPNELYQDFVAIDDTNDIAVTYESGWQSYGGYWTNKRLWDGFYPILGSDTVTIAGYVDFSATPADTNITDQSGRYVYRLFNDNNVTGEYFKIKMSGSVNANFIFGGYRIEWDLIPDLRK